MKDACMLLFWQRKCWTGGIDCCDGDAVLLSAQENRLCTSITADVALDRCDDVSTIFSRLERVLRRQQETKRQIA